MAAPQRNFTFKRGDTFEFDMAVSRLGAPVDLTGANVWLTAKLEFDDTDAEAVFQKTLGGGITASGTPTNGLLHVVINPTDTDELVIVDRLKLKYDVQLKESFGKVSTILTGVMTVYVDVTRVI